MLLGDERAAVARAAVRLLDDALVIGTSGNVSVRVGERICVTPSGIDYRSLTAASIPVIDLDGRVLEGHLPPSSEVPMHTAVYRATDAGAVVHTHSIFATTVSAVCDELPAVHYLIALLGGPVRVAPYATYGTAALAEGSVAALRDRTAVLLANHGATTYGATLDEAHSRAQQLEWLCELYCRARELGAPRILADDELARVADRLTRREAAARSAGAPAVRPSAEPDRPPGPPAT